MNFRLLFFVAVIIAFPPTTQAQLFGVLYAFTGGADGGNPYAPALVQDLAGSLYGTTEFGGNLACTGGTAPGCGTVFKLDSGGETVLHSFTGPLDGEFPLPGVILDRAGNLYGTTLEGGTGEGSNGTVFKVTATGTESVLHSFTGSPDGDRPFSVLVRDSVGNLCGTTMSGGAFGFGVAPSFPPVKLCRIVSFPCSFNWNPAS